MKTEDIDLRAELAEIGRLLSPAPPPLITPLHFNGGSGEVEVLDDHGPDAASYGVYNPVAARVYLGIAGGSASAGNGLPVPAESVLILPIHVQQRLEVGIDAGELGASTATIYVMRFQTVQAFFAAKL